MSPPRLIKTDRLLPPDHVDRALLHDLACTFIEEKFKLTGHTEPTWLIAQGNNLAWFETSWQGVAEKQLTIDTFRKFFADLGIDCYASINEAWAFSPNIVPPDEMEMWLDRVKHEGLADIPDKYKDDIVMVTSFDKTDAYSMTRYKVTVRKPGRGLNFLGPRIDVPQTDQFSGRMWNLLVKEREADWVTVKDKLNKINKTKLQ